MKLYKANWLTMSLVFVGVFAVLTIAQSGGFLPASTASQRYQLSEFTPAGAGDSFTPEMVDSSGAVGWSGGGGGGIVFVPAATPQSDDADGGGGRVFFTEALVGETVTVGVLFEAFTSENSETGFGAGGATVEITRESGTDFRLQLIAEQNGQRLLMLSNGFSLTPEQQSEISSGGGGVTVNTTNRGSDNPFHLAEMTLRFAEGGSVIVGQIHILSPE
jgi:hypothetical protein